MYRLGVFLRPAGGFWPFVRENVLARGFLILTRYILPFWPNVFCLGNFYSEPVHFGSFGENV